MKACPYRKDFYEKLGSPQETVLSEGEAWVAALEKIVAQIQAFLPEYTSAFILAVHLKWIDS